MNKKKSDDAVPLEIVGTKILLIRGKRVMLDRDLAELYGVPTYRLNEQVKRNGNRFPEDFLFRLNDSEVKQLIANCDRFKLVKHSSHYPYAFTQEGVAMLSSVLRSEQAVQINVQIMRAFVKMREFLATNKELAEMVKENRAAILQIIKTIDAMKQVEAKPKRRIGFHAQ